MISRAEVLAQYKVDGGGYIVTRGRYYQEKIFVPHFWDKTIKAGRVVHERSPDGKDWSIFSVTNWDREQYPELANIDSVGVREEGDKVLSWVRGVTYRPTILMK